MTLSPARPIPFSVVAKPTGAACNLDCQYCFFLSKELLYDQKRQSMSEETLETYVKNFLAASPDGDVTMLWQGGEPTLRGLPFFERLIELCEKYRRPAQVVHHAVQTNGTLITEQWARFFKDNDVLVGISIDGPKELHDAYRLNRGGHGTHSMVIRGWEQLRNAEVDTNILCTLLTKTMALRSTAISAMNSGRSTCNLSPSSSAFPANICAKPNLGGEVEALRSCIVKMETA